MFYSPNEIPLSPSHPGSPAQDCTIFTCFKHILGVGLQHVNIKCSRCPARVPWEEVREEREGLGGSWRRDGVSWCGRDWGRGSG